MRIRCYTYDLNIKKYIYMYIHIHVYMGIHLHWFYGCRDITFIKRINQ